VARVVLQSSTDLVLEVVDDDEIGEERDQVLDAELRQGMDNSALTARQIRGEISGLDTRYAIVEPGERPRQSLWKACWQGKTKN
jgi:hypothetical protein